jgi:hypothetical protein
MSRRIISVVSSSVRGSGGGRFGIARKRTGADLVLRVSRLSAKSTQHLISSIRFLTIGTSPMVARRVSHRLRTTLNRVLTAGWGNSLRANGGPATQSAIAGGGAVGPVGPRTGTSSGILPGNSSGRGDSPGSWTGVGISGRGLPGGIPGGGSVGVPGVAGGISGGLIGVMFRSGSALLHAFLPSHRRRVFH